jgi:hypothetical protein
LPLGGFGIVGSDSEGSFAGTPRKKGSLATLREGRPGSEELLEEGEEGGLAAPAAMAGGMGGGGAMQEEKDGSGSSGGGGSGRVAKRQLWGGEEEATSVRSAAAPFGFGAAMASIHTAGGVDSSRISELSMFHRSITAPAAAFLEATTAAAAASGKEFAHTEGMHEDMGDGAKGGAYALGITADLQDKLQLAEEEEDVLITGKKQEVRGGAKVPFDDLQQEASRRDTRNTRDQAAKIRGQTEGWEGGGGVDDVVAEKLKQLPGLTGLTTTTGAAAGDGTERGASGVTRGPSGVVKGERVAMREVSVMALGGDARVLRLEAHEMISMWKKGEQQQQQ